MAASDGGIFNNSMPHRDYFPLIRQAVASHWQLVWSAIYSNKLRSIKNCTKPWSSSQKNRQYEVLAPLRIGHTNLPRGFLVERGSCLTVNIVLCLLVYNMCWWSAPALRRRGGGFFPNTLDLSVEERMSIILAQPRSRTFDIKKLILFL